MRYSLLLLLPLFLLYSCTLKKERERKIFIDFNALINNPYCVKLREKPDEIKYVVSILERNTRGVSFLAWDKRYFCVVDSQGKKLVIENFLEKFFDTLNCCNFWQIYLPKYYDKDKVKEAFEGIEKAFIKKGLKQEGNRVLIVFTDTFSPTYLLYGEGRGNAKIVKPGVLITSELFDTLGVLMALFGNRITPPFIKGLYLYLFTPHKFHGGWDFGDFLVGYWHYYFQNFRDMKLFRKYFLEGKYSDIGGYFSIRFLIEQANVKINDLFEISDSLRRIKFYENSPLFIGGYLLEKTRYQKIEDVIDSLYEYGSTHYRDLYLIAEDTVLILDIEDKNLVIFYSSLFKTYNFTKQLEAFRNWVQKIDFPFFSPVAIYLLPEWEIDSLRIFTQGMEEIFPFIPLSELMYGNFLDTLKLIYISTLLGGYIKRFNLNEKILPIWFTAGLPKLLIYGSKEMVTYDFLLNAPPSEIRNFIKNDNLPAGLNTHEVIELSYVILRKYFSPNIAREILEKAVSYRNFWELFNDKTFFSRWERFVYDTLYYKKGVVKLNNK